jgi:mono/diheme cytochrome c family protein
MARGKLEARWGALVATTLMAVALGCGGEDSTSGTAPKATPDTSTPAAKTAPAQSGADSAQVAAEAEQIFATRCFSCHGVAGAGDGPGSAGLSPAPRNFQDPAWQDEVSDEHIANIIMYGGSAVGRSPTMPGNPDLSGKPDVVAALVAYLRNLRAK